MNALHFQTYSCLKPANRGNFSNHLSLLNNKTIRLHCLTYLAIQGIGEIKPRKFRQVIADEILPAVIQDDGNWKISRKSISLKTTQQWLQKLGYELHSKKKGVYVDGHECPDVKLSQDRFLQCITEYQGYVLKLQMGQITYFTYRFMCQYNEETMQLLPLSLPVSAQLEHILVVQDELIFHINDRSCSAWLAANQQMLQQKGNGRAIHVSDFLNEKLETGRLSLLPSQLTEHNKLLAEHRLVVTDARKIIYLGKGKDDWWDMAQLLVQVESAINIFEYIHLGAIGIFVFDCSLAHEALSDDALNVNNMNAKPGGKQNILHNTVIPNDIPSPRHTGIKDTHGHFQSMVFPDNHPDPKLCSKLKGMMQVLRECEAIWDQFTDGGHIKPIGMCKTCKLLVAKRDAPSCKSSSGRRGWPGTS